MNKYRIYQIILFLGLIFFWEAFVKIFDIPNYILPGPIEILLSIGKNYPLLLRHTKVTFIEVILGFSCGTLTAIVLAMIIVYSQVLANIIYPLIIGSQTIPKIAIAPLLLIWFGYGLLPKIIVSAMICFFPIVITLTKGLNSVDLDLMNLLRIYGATRREIFFKVRIPTALPYFFAGLKTSAVLSVVGAVVGEFVGADKGLGYLIIQSDADYRVALMFASLFCLCLIGSGLFGVIRLVEKRLLYWHVSEMYFESSF